ncbi:DUF2969 domain-containing protein [Streptococcus fryi]
MSKKDKKIEIQLSDQKVKVNNVFVEGYHLSLGKKVIGEIAEIDGKFAVVKNENVLAFYKDINLAIENIIESFNLNH